MIRKVVTGDVSELTWFKSSYSSSGNGESCVEIAIASRTIHVRDSKHTAGPRLQLSPEAWAGFVPYAARG